MSTWSPNSPSSFSDQWLVRTGLSERGDVVTFYSYKGGTGRTMALVNCAGLLAQHLPPNAKPILLIDFDLEAPGLHRYLAPYMAPEDVSTPRVGVLEVFECLRKAVDEKLEQYSSDIRGNEHRLDDDVAAEIIDGFDFKPFIVDTTVTGLKLMIAGGFDDTYAERLARFNWEKLFNTAPALFRCLADRLAREYSFTFVDSRTGLTDTSGICTMLLPDVLILVFTPNNQSLTGIEHLVRKAANYRANASDSRELRVYPLPSRVDNQVENFRHVWRLGDPQHPLFGTVRGYQPMFQEVLESALGMNGGDSQVRLKEYFDVVQVPHSADYSYGERLCFAPTSPSDSLSIRASYEQFLPWLATAAQPWQNPAELLLNQQAVLWLHEAGVDDIPPSNEDWTSWFERLSTVLDNLQQSVVVQQPPLSADLRFDTSMVLALASAYRHEFKASSEYLQRAISLHTEDVSSMIPSSAAKQLLTLWNRNLSSQELSAPERRRWIEELDRVMKIWQPLRRERQAWLSSLSELAHKAAWNNMEQAALKEIVDLNRKGIGEKHPDTLMSMNNLASTLRRQGDLTGARQLQERVLEVRKLILDEKHPDTLMSMNNLASTLRRQGDLTGARQLQERVLEVRKLILGEEHPDTLMSMNNLASTLRRQGDLTGARQLQERVLEVRKLILGEEHPDTLSSNLVLQLIAKNKKTREAFLDLGNCGLTEIPREIEELAWLKSLSLSSEWYEWDGEYWQERESQNSGYKNDSLIELTPLARLSALQTLHVSGTQVIDLTPLAGLSALQTLHVSDTQITDLSPLARLSALQTLDVSGTQVIDLTPLAGLSALQTLHVSDTQITDLSPLARLSALQTLDVSGTQVIDLTPLADLSALQTLDVSDTQITDLSPLAGLSALQTLSVCNTRITDLSPLRLLISLGSQVRWSSRIWEGNGIYVAGCPLITPPPEIVELGNDAILHYFRERTLGEVGHLYEAKMLILGEGSAGKTSLLRRLYQPDLPLPTEKETTKGIAIYRHEFTLKNGRRFRLNVWDFGGKEIYHAIHQFFLTRRSLYVLVDDTRKDHKSASDEGFKYWLELIDVFGGHSPVLIFQNEKGGRSEAIDIGGIKGRYDNVKECYAGNLAHGDAADQLREGIEFFASNLSHIGEELPARWIKVRADIEVRADEAPYILQQEYFDIYRRHLEFDRAKALHLSRYLHDLGVFLHFQDDPLLTRTVILQNQWATEAVFRILDDETIKAQLGRFNPDDCARLWRDSVYADMHPELLALMQRFELCYELKDSQPLTWLAPQLLPPAKPQKLVDSGKPEDLVLRYRYDFLPKGIISRLTVRLHRFVRDPEMAWVTGVLFAHDRTTVLVELLANGSEIELRARGPERKALLSVIAADLDALNESFQGLRDKVDKRVPCNCKLCRTASVPEFFAHKHLLRRKEDNRLRVECPRSYEDVEVLELLDGIRVDTLPSWANKETSTPSLRTIRIFLASSAELREDRDEFDLYFRHQNDQLRKEGVYFQITRWENFLDAMSETRLQDEYNKAIRNCDIFVCLFSTKTSKFTEEEFDVAHHQFKEYGRPRIYTFFKNAAINISSIREEDLISLLAFRRKLDALGHFYTSYDSIEDLKLKFRDQLDKLFDEDN